jgi:hypothetical protein
MMLVKATPSRPPTAGGVNMTSDNYISNFPFFIYILISISSFYFFYKKRKK